ncbi:MAG TPA: hypothetical protein VF533_14675 [Solirubrobacteraceae bacterium]|jgi:dipeptidyl aminopeptidase/acylaminoacyl peptidase
MARSRPLLIAALALAGLAAGAPPAAAGLVFVKEDKAGALNVWISADDGTGQRRLAEDATSPKISPDGLLVAYLDADRRALRLTRTDGGEPRELYDGEMLGTPKLSPDGSLVAVTTDDRLLVFETDTGRMGVVARAEIGAFSFSPDGQKIVYDATRNGETNLYTVSVLGDGTKRLTKDGRSLLPVWGAKRIAFVRKKVRTGAYDVWTMTARGKRVRRLTKLKVPDGASGLAPVAFSDDGRRMIGQYIAGPLRVGFTVNPFTGKTRALRRKVAFDVARDGSAVLTQSGGAEERGKHNVYAAPYDGGKSVLLVRKAFLPDWSR